MSLSQIFKETVLRRTEPMPGRLTDWLLQRKSTSGVRSLHLWIITALMALIAFFYYVDQTSLATVRPFSSSFFVGVHDLQRTLFLVPTLYAAVVFRLRGVLVVWFGVLCIVLPRALLGFSPYADALLRPVLFVVFAAFAGALVAVLCNEAEREKAARAELSAAYQELSQYDQRLRESQEQLVRAEKLTSLGELAASIAHEINNPLAGVLVYTRLLCKKIMADTMSKENALDYLSKMDSGLTRSSTLVQNLLDFARQSPPTLKEVDLNEVLSSTLEITTHSADLQRIRLRQQLQPRLPKVLGDFDQLRQVCTNLILNAIQAMPEGGILTIRTSAGNGQVTVEVEDTGCGIAPENMSKLFTPFFTTKAEVKGVGLGLAVSHGIVQRHEGKIDVQSQLGKGSIFTICLPIHPDEDLGEARPGFS